METNEYSENVTKFDKMCLKVKVHIMLDTLFEQNFVYSRINSINN